MRTREALDMYDKKPEGMINYLQNYGWHFNKKMCEWAVSLMKKKNPTTNKIEKVDMWDKAYVDNLLTKYNITLENNYDYDACYVANMAKADFYKSSLQDEKSIALYIRDIVDDVDQADGFIFSRFYSDCVRKGIGIMWDDML